MGNEIPRQLAQFFRSILMGGALALLYDAARSLRVLGGKVWEILLDALVSISSVFAVFLLVMAEEGELRLFILLGTLGGAVLFFSLISPTLRPVLSFWVELALFPLHIARKLFGKLQIFFKKVFSFLRRWFTIIVTLGEHLLQGERTHGQKKSKTENSAQQ